MTTYTQLWQLVRRIAFTLLVLLVFFGVIELFRIFAMFHRYHPALGIAFVVVCAVGGYMLFRPILVRWREIPRALKAPPIPDLKEASYKECRRYVRYLMRYAERLSVNPHLSENHRALAKQSVEDLARQLAAHPLIDDFIESIQQVEAETIVPCLDHLQQVAERDLRAGVRDIMLGVSLSPYHSMDMLIVLYRNANMVFHVARTFQGRPHAQEQWMILMDVMKVVATVNFMNVSKSLFESLFNKMPLVGRVVEDMGEGLGAGLFTSAAGHAAIYRCAAYQGWDRARASETVMAQTRQFLDDVRNIFIKDVLPSLRSRIVSMAPDKAGEPGFWDSVVQSVQTAMDAAAQAVGRSVIQPTVSAVADGMARVAPRRETRIERPSDPSPEPAPPTENPQSPRRRKYKRRPPKGIFRVLRTWGQRVRYTLTGPKS